MTQELEFMITCPHFMDGVFTATVSILAIGLLDRIIRGRG